MKLIAFYRSLVYLIILVQVAACNIGGERLAQDNSDNGKTNKTVLVYAAASLSDVLIELADSFEVKFQVDVMVNLASSGTLARQIEQGGKPDIYMSANQKWADYVDSLGIFVQNSKTAFAQNELVLITSNDSPLQKIKIDSALDFMSLLRNSRLSIGDPSHVPAGKYAKQSLEYFGWYNKLSGKLIPAKDVRSALMVVEMQEAPLGIVYKTDAQKSKKVKILNIFPEESHKPIKYIGGVCNNSQIAKDFFYYLNAEESNCIWEKYGFQK